MYLTNGSSFLFLLLWAISGLVLTQGFLKSTPINHYYLTTRLPAGLNVKQDIGSDHHRSQEKNQEKYAELSELDTTYPDNPTDLQTNPSSSAAVKDQGDDKRWESKYTTIQGVQFHYKDTGPPPGRRGRYRTVVLLHGFAGSTACWDAAWGGLAAAGARVVAFDRPAFGLTSRPTAPLNLPWSANPETLFQDPYGVDFSVAALWRLLDRLRVPRAVLVGHSLGCQVALRAARARPRRAEGAVLLSPAVMNAFDQLRGAREGDASVLAFAGGAAAAGEGGGMQTSLKEKFDGAVDSARVVWGYGRFMASVNIPRYGLQQVRNSILQTDVQERVKRNFYDPEKVTPEMAAKYARPLEEKNWDLGLVYFYRANQGEWEPGADFIEKVKQRWTGPALVLTGETDGVCPPPACARVAELLGCPYRPVPRCGHNLPDERPGAVVAAVRGFLAALLLPLL